MKRISFDEYKETDPSSTVDYNSYKAEVEAREKENTAADSGSYYLSYTGEWGENGKWNDGSIILDSGQRMSHGDLWNFYTRYKYLQKLSNIPDPDGHCLVGYNAKKLGSCLELGCDWGHCFDVFEHYFHKVQGIEVIEGCAAAGVANGRDITHGVMEDLPYADESFDVVLSNHVLEHSLTAEIVLKEVYRVTKPGGWSIHTLPCRVDEELEEESLIHKTILTYNQWLTEFEGVGFVFETGYFSWNHNQEEFNIIAQKVVL